MGHDPVQIIYFEIVIVSVVFFKKKYSYLMQKLCAVL